MFGLVPGKVAPFARKVIAILESKYDREHDRIFGKKML